MGSRKREIQKHYNEKKRKPSKRLKKRDRGTERKRE